VVIASLSRRVKKLEGPYRNSGECRHGPTVILGEGEPLPPDAPVCLHCGEVHALVLVETIVAVPDAGDDLPADDTSEPG
jgi:hypothetical protein